MQYHERRVLVEKTIFVRMGESADRLHPSDNVVSSEECVRALVRGTVHTNWLIGWYSQGYCPGDD